MTEIVTALTALSLNVTVRWHWRLLPKTQNVTVPYGLFIVYLLTWCVGYTKYGEVTVTLETLTPRPAVIENESTLSSQSDMRIQQHCCLNCFPT